ncbi:MBL fold metallo-hydrolase [Pararhodobacter aggregans]|uniref:MBL fold metallo-hydrolase n=1 Tax=Pararhodobacter aggregans TaxID=404875 RepID=A0A2T7URZ5_9RHOB|nr:MBL fold metallo-hydrolase [Pararhodobacter aggregans]PTX00419.1 ribonuclease Z [Pararhodobacter aggregans]PVE47396.1 MBL fold metallo-hydrolase [Pararhodobacter aggregans]
MNDDVLKVTLLGTGIPNPSIHAFGTSTLIEAGGEKVMIDCGRGTVIRMSQLGIPVGYVDTVILSHYHSDHYAGIFDLLMSGTIPQGWAGRGKPLTVYGPEGLEDLAEGAWQATRPDRNIRVNDNEIDPEHMRIIPHVYNEGVVYDRGGLVIRAILVDHGDNIPSAYGFRVEYKGRVFVHSHDTRYNENLIAQAMGADVFVHEIAAARDTTLANYPKVKVAIDHHASPTDVGKVFAQTRPRLAMLTHLALLPPDPLPMDDVLGELAAEYDGIVLIAEDLMTIRIGRNVSIEPYRHPAR